MADVTFDFSFRNLDVILEPTEDEAACDQSITLQNTGTKLEVLVTNPQFTLLLDGMINHAIDNELLSKDDLDKLSHKLGFHCQDREMVEVVTDLADRDSIWADYADYVQAREKDATSTSRQES